MSRTPSFAACLAGALLLAAAACTSGAQTGQPTDDAQGTGILSGRVVGGPASPIEGIPGAGEPKPVPGVELSVRREAGGEALTLTTDGQGEFRENLAAGGYRVDLATPLTTGFTKDLPRTVTVAAGQTTRLEITLDTGIR
jgi:hypothetical protein